ncbi:MAG TPA: hypothetical protein VM537_05065 [Anaerolineae bacterium]|nr:hypothetical protein [Anaerolineae bacterium]
MADQRQWHCKNCGRHFSVEEEQTPRSCPFCGSTKLRPGTTSKAMVTIADYLAEKMAVESDPRRGRPL